MLLSELIILFIRSKNTYEANLNLSNGSGAIASIDAVLRSFDPRAKQEQQEIEHHDFDATAKKRNHPRNLRSGVVAATTRAVT